MGKKTKRIGRSPHRNNQVPRHRKESTTQKIRDLDANIDALVIVDALVRQTKSPFIDRVMRARVSSKFKLLSQLRIYKGKTNPMGYLETYKNLMTFHGYSDEVMCKAFSATLKGSTRTWFRKLSPGNIDSFGYLSRLFVANSMNFRVKQNNASHLFTIHQKEEESLKDYIK